MKRTFWHNFKQISIIFLASLASAVAVELFLLPANTITGGALGLASILDIMLTSSHPERWYFSAGVWLVLLNVPIIIYCFCKFRLRFTVKTMIYLLLLGAELVLLRAFNVSDLVTKLMSTDGDYDRVIFVLLGGALHGISLPMLLSVNASSGGTDLVGLLYQRHSVKSSSDAMRLVLAANAVILVISSVVYYFTTRQAQAAVDMFIYSVAAMALAEIVQETIFKGFSAALELEVTTDKPQEMVEALRSELKHGVTSVKVMGGYSHREKTLILCVINKSQLIKARKVINKTDPQAFAYVENVKEVIGKGFSNKEIESQAQADAPTE